MQVKKLYQFMFLSLVVLLTACGYKPSSQYINEVFLDKVYVEVDVDRVEPENAPYVKDQMNRLVYTRFKKRVVNKNEADNEIYISYAGSRFVSLAHSKDGYVTRYRAIINVKFKMLSANDENVLTKSIKARVESDIEESSLMSSKLRTEAIRKGLEKALDQFMAYVSVEGVFKQKAKKVQ